MVPMEGGAPKALTTLRRVASPAEARTIGAGLAKPRRMMVVSGGGRLKCPSACIGVSVGNVAVVAGGEDEKA